MTADELRERAAKAICLSQGTPLEQYEIAEHYWRIYADAAIRVVIEAADSAAQESTDLISYYLHEDIHDTYKKALSNTIRALLPEEQQ